MEKLLAKKQRRMIGIGIAALLNLVLICCVIFSVVSAFNDAERVSFSQNIENVRTLTNASANKVELEVSYRTQRLKTAADYINSYHGVGMTAAELSDYFRTCYALQPDALLWQLVDSTVNDQTGYRQGFDAVHPCDDAAAFSYKAQAYPELARIFSTATWTTLGRVQYTSEFTDSSSLAKCFAVTTTIRLRDDPAAPDEPTPDAEPAPGKPGYTYKTLMLLIPSDDINALIGSNNDIDSLHFFNYSNIIIDDDGNYVISNSSFQGTNCIDYIALYNDTFTSAEADRLLANLREEDYFDVLYYQNNREQDCAFTIVPVQDSDWHILSIVPIASFHNAYDFNLNFTHFGLFFSLLFLVDIITALIINVQLRVKTREAEAANQSKSRFLSSMSHDIRTPLNAIIGMTIIADKALEADPVDKVALKDCMSSIQLSGNHLLSLINDILDITKIESGKISLHTSDFSVAETFSQVIEMCQSPIRDKDLTFEAHIQNVTHEYVTGDSLRINQIFINILTNAIKYTESGGKVTAMLSEQPIPDRPDAVRCVFTVSDTGIGMTPEFVDTIFDRFTRAVDTRINTVQGTGLGMAIVKQLVDLMDGQITVQSELNVGSTFTVTVDLPIVPSQLSGLHCQDIPILLIDDDPVLLQTVADCLRGAGAAVDTAETGADGIRMAVERRGTPHAYQLIFVDWKMDAMPGLEVIRTLRRELDRSLRIVVMTAYNVTEIEREAHDAGADAFVTKPLFKSKLISLVESTLSGEAPAPRPQAAHFPGMHILVAEDNDTNWRVLDKILRSYDVEADRAANGQAAVQMVEARPHPYDLIFMDIQMPLMNGYETTTAIRSLPTADQAATPIYAMTADTFASDIEHCTAAGMNGHLSKPIELPRVLALLAEYYHPENH